MKKLIAILLAAASIATTTGCVNCLKRCEEGTSFYRTAGWHGREHPYRSTKEIWDCVCLPFNGGGDDPILYGVVCITWPFWLVDDVLEGAVDTVLLPIDLIGKACSREADVKVEEEKVKTE